jgi:hypothetical protein
MAPPVTASLLPRQIGPSIVARCVRGVRRASCAGSVVARLGRSKPTQELPNVFASATSTAPQKSISRITGFRIQSRFPLLCGDPTTRSQSVTPSLPSSPAAPCSPGTPPPPLPPARAPARAPARQFNCRASRAGSSAGALQPWADALNARRWTRVAPSWCGVRLTRSWQAPASVAPSLVHTHAAAPRGPCAALSSAPCTQDAARAAGGHGPGRAQHGSAATAGQGLAAEPPAGPAAPGWPGGSGRGGRGGGTLGEMARALLGPAQVCLASRSGGAPSSPPKAACSGWDVMNGWHELELNAGPRPS